MSWLAHICIKITIIHTSFSFLINKSSRIDKKGYIKNKKKPVEVYVGLCQICEMRLTCLCNKPAGGYPVASLTSVYNTFLNGSLSFSVRLLLVMCWEKYLLNTYILENPSTLKIMQVRGHLLPKGGSQVSRKKIILDCWAKCFQYLQLWNSFVIFVGNTAKNEG